MYFSRCFSFRHRRCLGRSGGHCLFAEEWRQNVSAVVVVVEAKAVPRKFSATNERSEREPRGKEKIHSLRASLVPGMASARACTTLLEASQCCAPPESSYRPEAFFRWRGVVCLLSKLHPGKKAPITPNDAVPKHAERGWRLHPFSGCRACKHTHTKPRNGSSVWLPAVRQQQQASRRTGKEKKNASWQGSSYSGLHHPCAPRSALCR